jgi:hypothetical protein
MYKYYFKKERKRRCWVLREEREGVGGGREMTQTLYARYE